MKFVALHQLFMAQLHRLESQDPRIAGVLVTFDHGYGIEITWSARAPIRDPRKEAQSYAVMLVDALKEAGKFPMIESTNWVSVTAAICKHLTDFNARLLAALTPPDYAPTQ